MLTKNFQRTRIPAVAGVEHQPAATVCVTPPTEGPVPGSPGGSWNLVCTAIVLPPGVIGSPYFCYYQWEPYSGG